MRKLDLNQLEVSSFVTGTEAPNKKTVKGGTSHDDTITIIYGTCNRYPCYQIP
ncbi:MAG: pinensin family lanthipeptide [Cyclobacteriaceae bacterium]